MLGVAVEEVVVELVVDGVVDVGSPGVDIDDGEIDDELVAEVDVDVDVEGIVLVADVEVGSGATHIKTRRHHHVLYTSLAYPQL